jgi:DNA polymerase-3 subunit alpha
MQRCPSVEKQLVNAVIAGMIVNLRIINTRRGDKMAFVSLDDGVSRVEVSLFSELYGLCHLLLDKDKILIVTGELKRKEGGKEFEMIAQSASDIAGLRQEKLQAIRISIKSTGLNKQTITRFKKMLSGYLLRGNVLIEMIYQRNNGVQGLIQFSEEWKVNVCDELFDEISSLFGAASIQYIYDTGEIRNGLTFKAPPPRFNYNRRDSSKPHAAI